MKTQKTSTKTNTKKTSTTTVPTNTNINKEETVMKNTNTTTQKADNQTITKEMLAELNKLVLEKGLSLEEAMQQVWTMGFTAGQKAKATTHSNGTPKRDNLAYIEGLNDIPEVRRVKKVAYAKKSKSKNNPEAVARYEKEIAAADAKLNTLLAMVEQAETPWLKAKELGETVEGQFNYFLLPYEDDLSKKVDAIAAKRKATKAQVKAILLGLKPEVPAEVPEELKPAMQVRIDNKDMRVVTVARKAAFVKKYSK